MNRVTVVLSASLGLAATLLMAPEVIASYCGPYGAFGAEVCCKAADPASFESGKLCGEITAPDGTNLVGGCIDLTTTPPTVPGGCIDSVTTSSLGCPDSAAFGCAFCGCAE